ncbi:MAG: hypothetical protein OCD02_24055 [Spirochaetaceae bacterium]
MYKAECHCGNVKLEFNELSEDLADCNCSICRKIGMLWLIIDISKVSITIEKSPTTVYLWGEKNLEYHHCPICGCTTHAKTVESAKDAFSGINARLVDDEKVKRIPVKVFDGADTNKYLE